MGLGIINWLTHDTPFPPVTSFELLSDDQKKVFRAGVERTSENCNPIGWTSTGNRVALVLINLFTFELKKLANENVGSLDTL